MRFQAIVKVAMRQHGLVTNNQLNMLISVGQRKALAAGGYLRPVRRNVYSLAGAEPSWPQQAAALSMVIPEGVALSHDTAARLWRLTDVEPAILDLSCTRRLSYAKVRTHRTWSLPEADMTKVAGLTVTTVERTLFDVAASWAFERTLDATEEALRTGLTTLQRLISTYERLGGQGRPGSRVMAEVLAALDPDDRVYKSRLERRVLQWITDAGLARPVPQQAVVVAGKSYRLDFAYPDAMIAIEADGFRWHSARRSLDADAKRELLLNRLGWQVLRVTWHTEPELFVDSLRQVLLRRSA